MENLFCETYVDYSGHLDELTRLVAEELDGTVRLWSVEAKEASVGVIESDDYDPRQKSRPDDGFLFFPFNLKVDPSGTASRDQYVAAVRRIVERLRREGHHAVAACDFEEEISSSS